MFYESNKAKLPVKAWLPFHEIESGALDQAFNAANHPRAFHHIALAPDVHSGYSVPIGCIVAFDDCLVPAAVGMDIGCGMLSSKTNLTRDDLPRELRERMLVEIKKVIPTGPKHHEVSHKDWMPEPQCDVNDMPIVKREWSSAIKQVGTLGGGK